MTLVGMRLLSQVWWRALALDAHRRALLLRYPAVPEGGQPEASALASPTSDDQDRVSPVLAALLSAIEPAIALLAKAGVDVDASRRLHADWLTWAVGQCVLAGPTVGESRLMALESEFIARMERQLLQSMTGDGRGPDDKPDTAQSDLFS